MDLDDTGLSHAVFILLLSTTVFLPSLSLLVPLPRIFPSFRTDLVYDSIDLASYPPFFVSTHLAYYVYYCFGLFCARNGTFGTGTSIFVYGDRKSVV